MKTYNLPCYDTRKSFYGKARVIEHDNGRIELCSYNTIVCEYTRDGVFTKRWDGYSATTMRHINSFLKHFGRGYCGGKSFWDKLLINSPTFI